MIFLLLPVVIILHLSILNSFQFTAWPELLSYPYLYANGFEIYKNFIVPYPPLLILVLNFVFQIFGFSPEVLKYLTWNLIILTDIALFASLLIQKKSISIIFFLTIYCILQSFLDGNMLWFDYASILPIFLSFIFIALWAKSRSSKHLVLCILFLSIGVLVKQVTVIYLFPILITYLIHKRKLEIKDLKYFLQGFIPLFLFLLLILFNNSFFFFWNWAIYFPLTQWSKFPGYVELNASETQVFILLLLFAPLFFLIFVKKKFLDKNILTTVTFLIFAVLTIYPRFSFFHFQATLVFLIIFYYQIFNLLTKKLKIVFILFLLGIVFIELNLLMPFNKGIGIRFYGEDEKKLSLQIKKETSRDDKIYLLGPSSSIYVLSDRVPPKNWADNFGWYLEIPGVQEWVLEGFKKTPPKYIFWQIPQNGNWFDLGTYQPKKIANYIKENYYKKGMFSGNIEIWIKK